MSDPETKCPVWDQFIIPILALASQQEITRKIAGEEIPPNNGAIVRGLGAASQLRGPEVG